MTVIKTLAGFVAETTTVPAETVENVKMHLLDTLGAMLAGPKTPDGVALGNLTARLSPPGDIPVIGYPFRSTLLPAILAECAAARCTEIDDIHLESCTTPGSVIIPTALSLAYAGYGTDPADFLTGVALGYELLIRLGMAINGPEILYQGIWPTYLTATLGSATVAARALKLNPEQAASALAMALAMSTGVGTRVRSGLSSRWVTLGIAAQNGVVAAFSAQEGFLGNDAFLDKAFGQVHGLKVSHDKLVGNLGQGFLVDRTGMKPYPVGRQALSAVESFREIITNNRIAPEAIQEVSVRVPRHFAAMIDHPQLPAERMDSVRSVQYQMALAAFNPDSLYDVQRDSLMTDERVMSFMEKIRIEPSEGLESSYPTVWPAQVELKAGGQTYTCEMLHPKGDPGNRFSWDEAAAKFGWAAKPALDETKSGEVSDLVRKFDAAASLSGLLKLLGETSAV